MNYTEISEDREANKVAEGDLQFGLSLLAHLGKGNISCSPTSIRMALGMLYEGAKGDTAKQIAQVALLPEDASERHLEMADLAILLNQGDAPYTLRCANGVWVEKKYPVHDNFKIVLRDCYGAQAQPADFEGDSSRERADINKWVGRKTEGKIPELFPPDSIGSETILVLANALYFKAPWRSPFNPKYTQKQDFTLSDTSHVQVDMMRKGKIEGGFELPKLLYGEFDRVKVVVLPYQIHTMARHQLARHQLVKMIVLPPKGTSVGRLEDDLRGSHNDVGELLKGLESTQFSRLEIPRHSLKGSYNLKSPLISMGIERIFSQKTAELGGIGPGRLFVTDAIHKTDFTTDEKGSEGAAATGFTARCLSAIVETKPPVEFVADRPFLEMILEEKTGAVLFLNRVEDPR